MQVVAAAEDLTRVVQPEAVEALVAEEAGLSAVRREAQGLQIPEVAAAEGAIPETEVTVDPASS